MTLVKYISDRLLSLGVNCLVSANEVQVIRADKSVKIKVDSEWENAFAKYRQARSLNFDEDARILIRNNSVEVQVTRLATAPLVEQYSLSDQYGNAVAIAASSQAFSFCHFESVDYEKFFELRVKRRLLETRIFVRNSPAFLFWSPVTAVYTHKGRKTPTNLKELALEAVRRSLFKIAVEQHDCLSIWKSRNRRLRSLYLEETSTEDMSIPLASYDENVVSYYKVAKASPFPSQSFLAYYHVLEYNFLRVSELVLHDHLTALLNNPSFRTSKSSLDKVISTVRGQDARADETEMLRNVLERFVIEADLIDFIQKFEEACQEKIYSKKRPIFGEQLQISLVKDHALSNAAKVLKHIRNAIVHSSDRYKRDDCHIPLSDSEGVIEEFIPLVRFFAERVIFGTANS